MADSPRVPTLDDIRDATHSVHHVAPATPLVETADLSRRVGQPVFLKCELWQPMGAFKVRGAWTAISRLSREAQSRGIITHSSGNHGQAVAFVSQRLGLRAVIVMPKTAPAVKVEGVKRYGGEIVFTEAISSARLERAAEKPPRKASRWCRPTTIPTSCSASRPPHTRSSKRIPKSTPSWCRSAEAACSRGPRSPRPA
jgi:threonine dehydratase